MTLEEFFASTPAAALAFSGGVDSAYLLYAATRAGIRLRAYYVNTCFQPAFELRHARRLAEELGADLAVLDVDVLSDEIVRSNLPDRCYHCKRRLFTRLTQQAAADGFPVLMDGTNASDDAGDRPGMRALRELNVVSPLRLCGITKAEIRRRSREAGLFTADKPAYACLATRFPAGTALTAELLARTERAEDALFDLGFSDFRVRYFKGAARVQLPSAQLGLWQEKRKEIAALLGKDYEAVLLDMVTRDE